MQIQPAMKKNPGFTLIELLIVISIIATLSVVGLVSYTNFMKNSRDARRQSDLKFIQSALEDYHADNLYYPFTVTPGSPLSSGTKTYMTKVPNDPLVGNHDYSYEASGSNCAASTPQNCTSYCLSAAMEGTNTPENDPGCTPAADRNYVVTRP